MPAQPRPTRTNPTELTNGHTDRIPAWVLNHLEEVLPSGVRILNGRDLGGNRFLLNSTDGAVLVRKTRIGEPVVEHVRVPGRPASITCSVCHNHMVVLHPHEGQAVYCSRCGTPYRLEPHALHAVQDGDAKAQAAPPTTTPADEAPFTHKGYTLYSRDVDLKTGGTQTIYFFAKKTPKSGSPSAKPEGYEVGVNDATGLPYLQKIGHRPKAYRPQCEAVTGAGKQCRNSARQGSKYCASHKGYRPTPEQGKDTKPRVRKARDTLPARRQT